MTREEAVRIAAERLVETHRPERLYLYGSTARGDYREDSDIDFMLVMPDDASVEAARQSRRRHDDIPYSISPNFWSAGEFDRRLHLKASFPSAIVREGRLLYDRTANRG
jgi:predicted nucleotidyltransferase